MNGVIIKVEKSGLAIFRKMNARLGVTPKWYYPKDKAEIRAVVVELRRCGCTIREGKINEALHMGMKAITDNPASKTYTHAKGPKFKIIGATNITTDFQI